MRKINEVIIHCTATRPEFMLNSSNEERVAEIKRWHVEGNGWSDIAYHYLINRDGEISKGRPLWRTGAHCRGRNSNSVGVSLFGGFGSEADDEFEDHFTLEQLASLEQLVEELVSKFGKCVKISGHNEYANKACPGFQVEDLYPR